MVFVDAYDGESFGMQNIPKEGGFLIACNHASFFDPAFAGGCISRPIYYFARKSLFKGFLGWLLPRVHVIPVDRGEADFGAFKQVLTLLKKGKGVMVFPEGTRSPDGVLQFAKKGIGMMACKTGVPVVPTRIFGSYEIWGRQRKVPALTGSVKVVFGSPLMPQEIDPGEFAEDRYQVAANRIMAAIAAIQPPQNVIV